MRAGGDEVTVNDGLGSPPEDSFVATDIKVLDGTPDYPLKVAEVIAAMKKRHAEYLTAKDAAMTPRNLTN